MKNLLLLIIAVACVLFSATSCSMEQVMPEPSAYEGDSKISSRTDFSGLEAKVKIKIAERDRIPVNSIITCNHAGFTPEGYGRYNFTTNTSIGFYLVIHIIGDDIDGI